MRIILRYLLFAVIIFTGTHAYAQGHLSISGIVTNEKGEPLRSATVL